VHKRPCNILMTFFQNADSVPVGSPSSGSGQNQATKYISCTFAANFRSSPGDILDLLKSGVSVRPYMCMHFRLSVNKVFFSDLDLIRCVGRPRTDMGTSVISTRSKVKVKVTGLLKFRKLHFSISISFATLAWSSKLMVGHVMVPGLQLV